MKVAKRVSVIAGVLAAVICSSTSKNEGGRPRSRPGNGKGVHGQHRSMQSTVVTPQIYGRAGH